MNTHDYIVEGLTGELPRTMTLAEARATAERMWLRVVSRLFPDPPDSSGEWHRFGTHVACRGVPLEFAGEEDSEDGLPVWERVIEPETRDFPLTDVEQWDQVTEPPCATCGTPVPQGAACPVCHPVIEQAPRGFGGLASTTSLPPIV